MYSCTLVLMYSCTHLVNVYHTATVRLLYLRKNIPVYILYTSGPANNLRIPNAPTECHPLHQDTVGRPRGRPCHPGSASRHHPQCLADTVSAPPHQRGYPPRLVVLSPPKLSPPELTGPKCAAAVHAAAVAAATLSQSPECKACCSRKPTGCYTQEN